jgi:hypothetical protein
LHAPFDRCRKNRGNPALVATLLDRTVFGAIHSFSEPSLAVARKSVVAEPKPPVGDDFHELLARAGLLE